MDILLYLSELLQQRTSVGLTGLGTFFKKKFAGRYDKEKQSFFPPGYTLQFTTEIKDEELLPNFISEKRNISAESAAYYIAQFVEDINKKLEIEHEAELENLGRLFFTEHEGLSFEPAKNINYGSEFYGLPSVAETEINSEAETKDTISSPQETEEEVYEEIAEAPVNSTPISNEVKNAEEVLPVIENIELDEVKDDLKNTLSNTTEAIDVEHEEISVPDAVIEQHEEQPNRFGHQPESEIQKTYVNLNEDVQDEENVIEAPEFIKEQHAEHPNRFGHDPITAEVLEEDEEANKSGWSKIWIAVFVLILIAVIIYFIKPEWFGNQAKVEAPAASVTTVDSSKIEKPDTAKIKQDSIAKTDSILKANQVQSKADTQKTKVVAQVKTAVTKEEKGVTTYEVIGASFKTEKKAEQFIQQMKGYGITARIVPIEGPYKKVSIASYKTEKEAVEARPALSKKVRIKELDIKQINTP
ncbi:SPOR domain-containing protein [Pedobacter aquatilis]|uniref:SPOR domain-containing protein n=1 Tax=Pedobacter aquatilis TaxID=351343 RepID=UPI00292CBA03|nr:SPOR domain-containing protein [Pedobacter aquatilis]